MCVCVHVYVCVVSIALPLSVMDAVRYFESDCVTEDDVEIKENFKLHVNLLITVMSNQSSLL